ncbi:hypothetical protein B0H13DRAFT_2261110 [Mycena leptocephala]|nr:hypothetical protein B0H13DRAFT_2261110 [Mycena leptocephala]
MGVSRRTRMTVTPGSITAAANFTKGTSTPERNQAAAQRKTLFEINFRRLVLNGADVNAEVEGRHDDRFARNLLSKAANRISLLSRALQPTRVDVVKLLYDHGADPNIEGDKYALSVTTSVGGAHPTIHSEQHGEGGSSIWNWRLVLILGLNSDSAVQPGNPTSGVRAFKKSQTAPQSGTDPTIHGEQHGQYGSPIWNWRPVLILGLNSDSAVQPGNPTSGFDNLMISPMRCCLYWSAISATWDTTGGMCGYGKPEHHALKQMMKSNAG